MFLHMQFSHRSVITGYSEGRVYGVMDTDGKYNIIVGNLKSNSNKVSVNQSNMCKRERIREVE